VIVRLWILDGDLMGWEWVWGYNLAGISAKKGSKNSVFGGAR